MSIIDKKKKIFGNIAAATTLTEGLPKLKTSSSFPSVNNGGNTITFLTDLIKSLIGYAALVVVLVDILTHSLADIEREIKKALKTSLKDIVSCGVDPSLPAFIKSTGTGIVIDVNKIDFLDMFKTDPNSIGGKLMYNNITTPLTNSTDFNTFLYGVIQNDGTTFTWANIFDITFNSIGTGGNPNNTFTIKANSSYNSKTLTDLNNNFIDSLTLFNSEGIVNRIIDILFGSVAVSINKTTKQLENDAKINNVVDSMINSDADDTIDDNYFTFTNDEVYVHQQEADLRKKGIVKLECCNKVAASVPVSFLTDFNTQMSAATTTQQKKDVISTNLDKMANQNTINATSTTDHISIKLNFIQQIINNLIKAIVGVVLSPKVVMIFLINYKIIYGPTATFGDAIDFIKKNKNLIHSMTKKISGMIIKILIAIALKQIATLVAAAAAKKEIEKGKNQLAQLLSLVGIPQETLRLITGLVSV
jgi:hypothetical protein